MSGGLSNSFLERIGKKILGSDFVGVFPCDVHRKSRKKTYLIIFNTGRKNTLGEHFVAIKIGKKSVFYFDPFGEPPTNSFIKEYISKLKRPLNWNIVQIHHNSSNFCGFYCLAYLMSVKKKMSFKKFLNLFSIQNKKSNDKKVVDFIVSNL